MSNKVENKSVYGVWDKVRVNRRFFNLLLTHPVFRREPKAINTAQFWLNAINEAECRNDGKPTTWGWKDIQDRFRPYKQKATVFRDALRDDLELITFTTYKPPANAFAQGECRKFSTTELCRTLLADGNYQWLHKLLDDPEVRRRNQVAISKRKKTRTVYTDPFLRMIDEFNHAVKFERDGLLGQLENDKTNSVGRFNSALHILLAFERKQFTELEVKNGRVYHAFVALPKAYRPFALLNGKRYLATVDIRACWPTFLGKLLLALYEFWMQEPPSDLEVADYLKREVRQSDITTECNRWTEIFTHPRIDPRQHIIDAIGLNIKTADMKQCLNVWLNGGKEYKRVSNGKKNRKDNRALEAWFTTTFPNMTKVWSRIDREHTGECLGDFYEGDIMMNMSLYSYAESMGLTLSYEYDGVGVFAKPNDSDLTSKLEAVKSFIQNLANQEHQLPVEVKVDLVG